MDPGVVRRRILSWLASVRRGAASDAPLGGVPRDATPIDRSGSAADPASTASGSNVEARTTVAYDRDGLFIHYRSSGARTTVVTFASLRHAPEPMPLHEFHKELTALKDEKGTHRDVNIVTVVDLGRRYYIDGIASVIASEVNRTLRLLGTRRTVALGASMGGFAAVALAKRLYRCDRVLAFGPHSSIHPPLVPFDRRSIETRSKIRHWDVIDTLDELDPRIRYDLLYGDQDDVDMLHVARFRSANASNVVIELIPGRTHSSLMWYWQQNDTLGALLSKYVLRPHRRSAIDVAGAFWRRVRASGRRA